MAGKPRRLFYGWVVVAASTFILFLIWGAHYSFGVFLLPLTDAFEATRGAISGLVFVRTFLSGIFSLGTGVLADRYGPRKVVSAGVILAGLGWGLSSFGTQLWHVYVSFGVLGGMGMAAVHVPIVSAVSRWFSARRRPLALGIMLCAFGLGQTVLPPAVTYLSARGGWQLAFAVIGAIIIVGGLPPALFLVRRSPAELGLQPDGKAPAKAHQEDQRKDDGGGEEWTREEALRTVSFWQLFAIYFSSALCFQIVMVHIIARAVDVGVDARQAALILSFTGAAGILGRILAGAAAGRLGQKETIRLSLFLQVPMFILFLYAREVWVFYLFGAFFGFGYSGISPLAPAITATFFGARNMGAVFGVMNLAYTLGAGLGPLIAGFIFDLTHSYEAAFLLAGGILAAGFVLTLFLKAPKKRPLQTQVG